MAPARQDRFVAWLERWGLEESGPPLEWAAVFGRRSDVVLDEQGRIGQVEFSPAGAFYDPVWDEIDRWYLDIPGPWNRLAFLEAGPDAALAALKALVDRYVAGEL